jgi:oligopeptide/dipeptide ABC transporter ATP-binding protein
LRENMKIIFQDPFSSLNPRMTVEQTIKEPLIISGHYSAKEAQTEAERLMTMVGIDQRLRLSYPHELDGGRRQRVGIGRALALNPKFIVCDEPVSALDVSIQAQVLNLLQDLQKEFGLTYMFVTHDLSVVRLISDDICVMYLGQLVETSPSKELFKQPLHPYTQALISAVPSIDIHHKSERIILEGEITSPIHPKPGCRFAKRCQYECKACREPQQLEEVLPGHFVACCRVKEINQLG